MTWKASVPYPSHMTDRELFLETSIEAAVVEFVRETLQDPPGLLGLES